MCRRRRKNRYKDRGDQFTALAQRDECGQKGQRKSDRLFEKSTGADGIGGKGAAEDGRRLCQAVLYSEPRRETRAGRTVSPAHAGVSAKSLRIEPGSPGKTKRLSGRVS